MLSPLRSRALERSPVRQYIRQLWSLLRTPRVVRVIRYSSVSVISTLVSLVIITIVFGLGLMGEVHATIFGNLCGVFPTYYLNRQWVWGKKGRSHLRQEVLPFLSLSLLGACFAMLGAAYAKHLVLTHHWSHVANTALLDAMNLLCFAIFWVIKLLAYNKIFHPGHAAPAIVPEAATTAKGQ